MENKNKIIIVALLSSVFVISAVSSFYLFSGQDISASKGSFPSFNNEKFIGSNDLGTVTLEGPYGNKSSPLKIAFIVGVHPLEYNSHKAIIESVKSNEKSLKYCYYIYKINVTKDATDYDKGRMNGQLLASEFVVPAITGQNYSLAIDIHSNEGNYNQKRFLFAPIDDTNSKSFALKIINNMSELVYYNPPSQTSPKYVTVPLIKAGTPTILYETYLHDKYEDTKRYADKFLKTVDNLKFS